MIKRNGVVEPFSREKIVSGVRKACQGRPVTDSDLAVLAQRVEETIRATGACADRRERHRSGDPAAAARARRGRLPALRQRVPGASIRSTTSSPRSRCCASSTRRATAARAEPSDSLQQHVSPPLLASCSRKLDPERAHHLAFRVIRALPRLGIGASCVAIHAARPSTRGEDAGAASSSPRSVSRPASTRTARASGASGSSASATSRSAPSRRMPQPGNPQAATVPARRRPCRHQPHGIQQPRRRPAARAARRRRPRGAADPSSA